MSEMHSNDETALALFSIIDNTRDAIALNDKPCPTHMRVVEGILELFRQRYSEIQRLLGNDPEAILLKAYRNVGDAAKCDIVKYALALERGEAA